MLDQRFEDIKDGDVLLVEGNSVFARAIKWRTNSKYSHAALIVRVCWDEAEDVPCVIEAQPGLPIGLTPLTEYLAECGVSEEVVHWFALTGIYERERIVDFSLNQLNKRYAAIGQFAVSFGWITPWVRKLLGHHDDDDLDPDRFFCSEFVAAALQAGGVRTLGEPATVSPGRLALCQELAYRGILRVDE